MKSIRIVERTLCIVVSLLFILISLISQAQVIYENDVLMIRSEQIEKRIGISNNGSGPVRIIGMGDSAGINLLPDAQGPYFQFVINNEKVSATDAVWRYEKHETRSMGNGGTEVIISIRGVRNPVKGLEITLYQQVFPGTTLMREKIVLVSEAGKKFKLNKLDGRLHFVFPQYAVQAGASSKSTEIRIASWASELIDSNQNATYDEWLPVGGYNDHNLAQNHMYHPKSIERQLSESIPLITKGPINILNTGDLQMITTYEHASQDDLQGLFRGEAVEQGGMIRDAGQGIRGVFNFAISPRDFHFLGIAQEQADGMANIAVKTLRGAYLDGEVIDKDHPYSSVWTATAFSLDTTMEKSKEIIHDYLWRCICEKPASRQTEFYYNTWGMQRRLSTKGHDLRGVFTDENIREEIRRAAELGVDIFVLDDGWEQAQGDWTPHRERLPEGLSPIREALESHGIKMGIWLSPMGIDSSTQRYKDHPEWIIKDSEGNPIKAQWNHPAFDFVSGFYDLFIDDCKRLIDEGARFFKWDAINTFYSTLPDLDHGSDAYSEDEIRARYEYLLPNYVTRAMEELTDYEPELVIEIDLTEARRVMVGLAPLSQGKLFWMNNGASSYNDYSVYRAKSMRSIPNVYAGFIPWELFTYANYPHNDRNAQRYNVNTSLIAGHGFWGALEEMTDQDRQTVGRNVEKCKRVLPFIKSSIPEVVGRVGDTPEIYIHVNKEAGAGQVIAFSGSAVEHSVHVALDPEKILGVMNHAYAMKDDELVLDFQFPMPDATREAFIIPNDGTGISIISSTSWIDEIHYDNGILSLKTGAPGKQVIRWHKRNGMPSWEGVDGLVVEISEEADHYVMEVDTEMAGQEILISSAK